MTGIGNEQISLDVKQLAKIKKYIFKITAQLLHPRFVPFFGPNFQGLFKDFQGHISHFSMTPCSSFLFVFLPLCVTTFLLETFIFQLGT